MEARKDWHQCGDASTRVFLEQTLQTMISLLQSKALTAPQRELVRRDLRRLAQQYLSEVGSALDEVEEK